LLILFLIIVVFSELSFFFEKQLLDHRAPLKIGADLQHCPIVRNVLLENKTLHQKPPQIAPYEKV
jgi:hypothetical protein